MLVQRVAYILLRFPCLTETFVAEEIHAVRARGVDVAIVSLLTPRPEPVQPRSQELLRHAWRAPGWLAPGLWQAQIYFLLQQPRTYGQLLVRLLRQPRPKRSWSLQAKRLYVFLKAVAVAHHLRSQDVQMLHAHFAWLSGAAAWVVGRLLGRPFAVTMHAFDIYTSNDLLPLVGSEAAQIVTISEYNRRQVGAALGQPSPPIDVIPCGVDLTRLQRAGSARATPAGDGPLKVLSVGSLIPKKGHTHLIEACRLLRDQGREVACTIIGGGPEEPALRRQIEAAHLQGMVRLLGAQPHQVIVDALHQHDVFVLASVVTLNGDRDGIPVVLMEAGAASLPLVSTQVSGIPELVRPDRTGLLVPPGNPEALATAIASLAADPALRARLGDHARHVVEAEFNVEASASRLCDLFGDTYHRWQNQPALAALAGET